MSSVYYVLVLDNINYLIILCNIIWCVHCHTHFVILYSLYYIECGRVSASPYCTFSLLYILLLDVFCSTIWNLKEYKLLGPVAILYCILTIRCYASYVFHEVVSKKLFNFEYSYSYCKMYSWICLLYFHRDIGYKIE